MLMSLQYMHITRIFFKKSLHTHNNHIHIQLYFIPHRSEKNFLLGYTKQLCIISLTSAWLLLGNLNIDITDVST